MLQAGRKSTAQGKMFSLFTRTEEREVEKSRREGRKRGLAGMVDPRGPTASKAPKVKVSELSG
jgi:hypothetical protein